MIAIFAVADDIRPESRETIHAPHALGIKNGDVDW